MSHRKVGRRSVPESSKSRDEVGTSQHEVRVLFMHGIESSPGGRKATYLKKHFKNVLAVDMHTSIWKLNKKNSVLRNLLLQRDVQFIFAALLAVLTFYVVTDHTLSTTIAVLLWCAYSWRRRERVIGRAIYATLSNGVARQRNAILKFKPDVVVGASFGGAVAMFCILEDLYHGPVVLLAPAHRIVNRYARWDWTGKRTLPRDVKFVIAHGKKDRIIPIKDSRILAGQSSNCTLYEIEDQHRLRSLLRRSANPSLEDLVLEAHSGERR